MVSIFAGTVIVNQDRPFGRRIFVPTGFRYETVETAERAQPKDQQLLQLVLIIRQFCPQFGWRTRVLTDTPTEPIGHSTHRQSADSDVLPETARGGGLRHLL